MRPYGSPGSGDEGARSDFTGPSEEADPVASGKDYRHLGTEYAPMVMAIAHAYAASGRKAEALRAIDELKNLASKTYVPALFFAPIYARLGEKEQAFQYLETAFAERTDYLIFLGREPLSDPVRSDPRFDALLRRLGLPH